MNSDNQNSNINVNAEINNSKEISAICFSSLPLLNFDDERGAFFGISLKTIANAKISESDTNVKIYGCDELKDELKSLINKIFEKFEFPYGVDIKISCENKGDKFSIFSAVGIAAYGVIAKKYGIIYDEVMEKKIRSDKETKRKIIKIRRKIYTYNEIFNDILSLIKDKISGINYVQAYTSYFGGIAVGKKNEILRYGENEDLDVILIPKRKGKTKKDANRNINININGIKDVLWDEILKGNFYTAGKFGCILESFKNECKFYEIIKYLINNELYCGMTEEYIFGVLRKGKLNSIEIKNLIKKENLIITTNNCQAGIY